MIRSDVGFDPSGPAKLYNTVSTPLVSNLNTAPHCHLPGQPTWLPPYLVVPYRFPAASINSPPRGLLPSGYGPNPWRCPHRAAAGAVMKAARPVRAANVSNQALLAASRFTDLA